jgi:hypothetical protein
MRGCLGCEGYSGGEEVHCQSGMSFVSIYSSSCSFSLFASQDKFEKKERE